MTCSMNKKDSIAQTSKSSSEKSSKSKKENAR